MTDAPIEVADNGRNTAKDLMPGILLSTALFALRRVLQLSQEAEWDFARSDIAHVESTWEWLDADVTAHGFVFTLGDGRRIYVQRVASFTDGTDDDVCVLPMADERYPVLKGGDFKWTNEVADMNRLLKFLSV
jgi:hypothetical protein